MTTINEATQLIIKNLGRKQLWQLRKKYQEIKFAENSIFKITREELKLKKAVAVILGEYTDYHWDSKMQTI